MKGLMMDRPLLVSDIIDYAAEAHADGQIISMRCEGDRHEQTYSQARDRIVQLSLALEAMGIEMGDRVATLAWNGYRHFELYYAIQGIGAVCHTINPRLSAEQLTYIVGHAEDRVLFTDLTFVPLLEQLKDQLPKLTYVIMTDRAHMPQNSLDALCYEELLEGRPTDRDWPSFDENTAAGLCYTSGTTGDPKGTLYTHRSNVLHAMIVALVTSEAMNEQTRVMPVVPLFHVNAWGLPYTAPLVGAELVFPGPRLDGASLWEVMEAEAVTSAWGVPTIWMGLLNEIKKRGRKPEALAHMVVGGSAASRSLIEQFEKLGVEVNHAWGMTEMSPIGTIGTLPRKARAASFDERMALKVSQGRRVPFVAMKIVDEAGRRLPHDGQSQGELAVRAPTVMGGYFNNPEASRKAMDAEGWFVTGDIATISPDGFLQLRDRTKDLIKSGGEWISSIDLENAAEAHPKIAQCAAIAVPHPRWDERPVLIVVPKDPGDPPTLEEVNALLGGSFARWQLPDDIILVESLPMTATGKISKLTLRSLMQGYVLPELREAG
ncbi:long-chain-fatty-acid--CoA ligase [Paracoccus sp. S-4012]|uniref:long-chain fatty acid--CoA ligase n=1 Tax=Paracoccus sp. S-4012 TaxID=2665648 RepID=UPI0012B062E6|nr:long-chain fatty acid--CoA ligase [Paracoccus sp. S-4012]MRX51137.1 long-chain-fatty-acid--CoA ligase [Paracoccus sp. S-4012]